MPELERPPSLTSLVTDHVRNMIIKGDVPLGSTLSERGISAELKVSKTPVREALAQLRNEGLVTIVPQSGVRVFTLSASEVREVCAFRKVLESAALFTAMANDGRALVKELESIVARMHKTLGKGDVRAYLELDTEYHQAFFNHCGNSYLQSAYNLYAAKVAALRTHLSQKPQHTSMSLAEHDEILKALRDKDEAVLRLLLDRHIGRTQDWYQIEIEDISVA